MCGTSTYLSLIRNMSIVANMDHGKSLPVQQRC